jgi:hypothetical protein
MNFKASLLLALCVAVSSLATTPVPFSVELRLLDRISAAAAVESEGGVIAVKVLELVAVGRVSSIEPEWEASLKIDAGVLRQEAFSDSSVREYALRRIGDCPRADALEFLEKLTPGDFKADSSGQLWPTSQIALSEARMNRLAGPQPKIDFLRGLLASKTSTTPARWVDDELCNRGALPAFPEVEASIRRRLSGQRAEDEVTFCRARMLVVARDPDKAVALGSVFSSFMTLANTDDGQKLLRWAIYQLVSMRSASADAELDSFANQLGSVLKGDPSRLELSELRREIDAVRKAARN